MREQSRAASDQPSLKKIDLTIARLRLLLAEITAREAALEDQRRTCREQRAKLVSFSLYGDTSLDSVLAMLGDVEERLASVDATARSLALVRERAAGELESLQLTKSIEEAKVLLRELQTRQNSDSPGEVDSEIARLRSLINEASERAGKSIHR
jgi:hypothetical protein